MPASPQYRYTRDEQQLSQLLRAIDGVTTRLAARYALVGGELLQDVVFHRAAASAGAPALGLGSGDLTVSARLDAIVPPATDAIASVEEAWAAIESWLFVPGARRVERLWVGAREAALA